MAKATGEKKTGTKKERAPFQARLTKKLNGLASMLKRMTDVKWAVDAVAEVEATLAGASKLALDYNPPGSASSARGFEVGDVVKVNDEFAFMFDSMKGGKTAKVVKVKKLGEGRGSKTAIQLENGVTGFAFQFVAV